MRLKKHSIRMIAASLCIVATVGLTSCSDGGGQPAQPQQSASSTTSTENGNNQTESKGDQSDSLDLSFYPLADSSMMMQGKTWSYAFRVKSNGEIQCTGAAADEVIPKNPPASDHYVKQLPFDYQVSTYVWDGQSLRCKHKGQLNAVQEENLVGKPGYKFVCSIDWMYRLQNASSTVDRNTGEQYVGWIPSNLVEDTVKEMSRYHDNIASFDKIPKGSFEDGRFVVTYHYFNGKFYKSVS